MFQYSLLQTVVEACQKKKHCKFNGAPHFYRLSTGGDANNYNNTVSTVNVDPCHKRRKIVEVAYKCRPCKFFLEYTIPTFYMYVLNFAG